MLNKILTDLMLKLFLQTVKALNHLKENLKIIHRGEGNIHKVLKPNEDGSCTLRVNSYREIIQFNFSQTSNPRTFCWIEMATLSFVILVSVDS